MLTALLLTLAAACSTDTPAATATPPPTLPATVEARVAVGNVVGVVDGVTIDVEIAGKVFRLRYLGVEVPDEGAPAAGGPSLGQRALEFNRFRVEDRIVELEKGVVDTDDAGRILRYVYVDGEMVNRAMVAAGYAVVAATPRDFIHRSTFLEAEAGARDEGRGYWQSPTTQARAETRPGAAPASPTPMPPFRGGTLPLPPGAAGGAACDYSGTSLPLIKGNVDSRTGERVYLVPDSFFYATTEVSRADGDRWFCTEVEAIAAGWTRAKY